MRGYVKHGHARRGQQRKEYQAWHNASQRCTNPNAQGYERYGGRGITFCDRWRDGDGDRTGYECFLAEVGTAPSPAHTLDRRDNERGYEPGNVRWVLRSEQQRNTRSNRLVSINGETLTVVEAVERYGAVSYAQVYSRLGKGWDLIRAITTPRKWTVAAALCALLILPPSPVKAESGLASWYAYPFHGRKTASGERFNTHALTAAHKTLRFGTRVLVSSRGKSVTVRINDRGPFIAGRVIDLSKAAAARLGMLSSGVASVRLHVMR